MKKLILILLFSVLVINVFSQAIGRLPYYMIRQTYGGDTLESKLLGDSVLFRTNKGYFNFNKPLLVNGSAVGGSTVYASDGLYKDADTVKLNNIIEKGNVKITIDPVAGYFELQNFSDVDQSVSIAGTDSTLIELVTNKSGLALNSTGFYYTISPDTTQTTPAHLMTEAQVKREIAARASQWTTTPLGIRYDGGGGDSICYDNNSRMRVYDGGILVYEQRGDGNISIGSDPLVKTEITDTYVAINDAGTGISSQLTNQGLIIQNTTDTTEITPELIQTKGRLKTGQISAALTDGVPTDSEIDTATGLTPSTTGAGYQVTIKDNNGTGLLYKVESDGTDWYYTVMTKAL